MNIHELLKLSIETRASDLHIKPNLPPFLRIDGVLTPVKGHLPLTPQDTKEMLYNLMTTEQQYIFETKRVCELPISEPDVGHFRGSIFHQLHGIGAVFRVISEKVPTFEELLIPDYLKSLLELSHGLILVAGPTGSGKTTTLAAMIDYINKYRACNIITIEDPVEFIHQNKKSFFNQLQVGRDTPDFASALRASLRQDPNVILIGELRDLETMRLALVAAETGHLVLATLHATSAPLAINRFVDVFQSEEKNRVRNLLSETLQAIIFQTLVKKSAGGRIAAFEVMLATPPIRHFIRQDMSAHMESTMQTSSDKGMCTLESYLKKMVANHLITSAVAEYAITSRGTFKDVREGILGNDDKGKR